MILRILKDRDSGAANGHLKIILLASIIIGAVVILSATAIMLGTFSHRKKATRLYRAASLRDPQLTRDEFERRNRLTRSRQVFEEEVQRANIIRKSHQSRETDYADTSTVESALSIPSPSKAWHGRSSIQEVVAEEGQHNPDTTSGWRSSDVLVPGAGQLLHSRTWSPPRGCGMHEKSDDDISPRRSPTIQLNTPPLISHPLFQNGIVRPYCGI